MSNDNRPDPHRRPIHSLPPGPDDIDAAMKRLTLRGRKSDNNNNNNNNNTNNNTNNTNNNNTNSKPYDVLGRG